MTREGRFPCDMVLLGAVHESKDLNNKQRRCHVNTKDLDGENNLKMRKGLPPTADLLCDDRGEVDPDGKPILYPKSGPTDDVWVGQRIRVECEPPNGDLDSFNGKLYVGGDAASGDEVSWIAATHRGISFLPFPPFAPALSLPLLSRPPCLPCQSSFLSMDLSLVRFISLE